MFDNKKRADKIDIPRPDPVFDLSRAIRFHLSKRRKLPSMFPHDAEDAARFWMTRQEPVIDRQEDMKRNTDRDGVVTGWHAPYVDRLLYTMKQFLGLTEPEQAFVIHGIESGVPWRGDSIRFYRIVCDETAEMKKDRDSYLVRLKECARKARDIGA